MAHTDSRSVLSLSAAPDCFVYGCRALLHALNLLLFSRTDFGKSNSYKLADALMYRTAVNAMSLMGLVPPKYFAPTSLMLTSVSTLLNKMCSSVLYCWEKHCVEVFDAPHAIASGEHHSSHAVGEHHSSGHHAGRLEHRCQVQSHSGCLEIKVRIICFSRRSR